MSAVVFSAVSSIQTTGNSITIMKTASRTISMPELNLRSPLRTGGAAVSPAMPLSERPSGWMWVAIASAPEAC